MRLPAEKHTTTAAESRKASTRHRRSDRWRILRQTTVQRQRALPIRHMAPLARIPGSIFFVHSLSIRAIFCTPSSFPLKQSRIGTSIAPSASTSARASGKPLDARYGWLANSHAASSVATGAAAMALLFFRFFIRRRRSAFMDACLRSAIRRRKRRSASRRRASHAFMWRIERHYSDPSRRRMDCQTALADSAGVPPADLWNFTDRACLQLRSQLLTAIRSSVLTSSVDRRMKENGRLIRVISSAARAPDRFCMRCCAT